jgi:enoyl-CoA hydratase
MPDDAVTLTSTPHEGVLLVTMNRPTAKNAVNDRLAAELSSHFAAFDENAELRVCVLAGAGGGFSAGLDLKAFLRGELGECPQRGFAGITTVPPRKPVIAAIEGFALAGGLEIALACDLLIAARNARIGIPEVKRGLVADGGALLRLPRMLPPTVAMQLALTGDEIPVERLHALGLINEVTEPGAAVQTALDVAVVIAANAPLGVTASKRVLTSSPWWDPDEAWDRQKTVVSPVWDSVDAQEGARAFAEKRAPRYTGR